MTEAALHQLKYPIGEFEKPKQITETIITNWITTIKAFPEQLEHTIKDLTKVQLNYKYRPNGWTIKQVIHHCADSHINSLLRFKLALTEDTPTIKPYFEDRFANLTDYEQPINASVNIIKGVHQKLGEILEVLDKTDLQRQFFHPEHQKAFTIQETIGVYAWHSKHHLTHIKQAIKADGEYN